MKIVTIVIVIVLLFSNTVYPQCTRCATLIVWCTESKQMVGCIPKVDRGERQWYKKIQWIKSIDNCGRMLFYSDVWNDSQVRLRYAPIFSGWGADVNIGVHPEDAAAFYKWLEE